MFYFYFFQCAAGIRFKLSRCSCTESRLEFLSVRARSNGQEYDREELRDHSRGRHLCLCRFLYCTATQKDINQKWLVVFNSSGHLAAWSSIDSRIVVPAWDHFEKQRVNIIQLIPWRYWARSFVFTTFIDIHFCCLRVSYRSKPKRQICQRRPFQNTSCTHLSSICVLNLPSLSIPNRLCSDFLRRELLQSLPSPKSQSLPGLLFWV